ncbi:hypothetical protein IT398_01280 [Candidatus Nomurabacteria bacterium]|nr:hypothetical protein [Candidatus Nomurabacteria bacterium]
MIDDKTPKDNLNEKRTEAQAAMAGAEWTAKHDREERLKTLQTETDSLRQKLTEINKEKELLELDWIELDNQRRALRTILNPLLDEEKKIESEEISLESEEARTGLAADKKIIEKKRWEVQDKRKEIEKKKWDEEEKLAKIETTVQANTAKYRTLLDEEEKIDQKLQELKIELATMQNG